MAARGVIAHHTAGPSTGDMPTLNILVNGRVDLPGPLCHYGLGRSGTVYVVASGKANHAGLGQWDARTVGGTEFIDHSYEVVGIEAEHTGKLSDPWPEVQLDAYHVLCAVILTQIRRPAANLCGHKEWAQPPESTLNRKPDPIGLDMDEFRAIVGRYMEEGVHTKADHAAGHWQGPNAWGDNAWAEYVAKKYTSLEDSRTWEIRREDLAWFRQKFLAEILSLIPEGESTLSAQDVRNIIRDAIANG